MFASRRSVATVWQHSQGWQRGVWFHDPSDLDTHSAAIKFRDLLVRHVGGGPTSPPQKGSKVR